jgi:DNA-directed RNA polymerase subunit M/transcription elongation factor TFIIS
MSGPIEDQPIRICPHCKAIYIEDTNMYEDVNRCPNCGKHVEKTDKDLDDEEEWG